MAYWLIDLLVKSLLPLASAAVCSRTSGGPAACGDCDYHSPRPGHSYVRIAHDSRKNPAGHGRRVEWAL